MKILIICNFFIEIINEKNTTSYKLKLIQISNF